MLEGDQWLNLAESECCHGKVKTVVRAEENDPRTRSAGQTRAGRLISSSRSRRYYTGLTLRCWGLIGKVLRRLNRRFEGRLLPAVSDDL